MYELKPTIFFRCLGLETRVDHVSYYSFPVDHNVTFCEQFHIEMLNGFELSYYLRLQAFVPYIHSEVDMNILHKQWFRGQCGE